MFLCYTWPISVNYTMFMSTEQFGCLVWSHSETHLLYVAEKKRPKTESFFQVYQKHQLCVFVVSVAQGHQMLLRLRISTMSCHARQVFSTILEFWVILKEL